jgi:hypothetical protein
MIEIPYKSRTLLVPESWNEMTPAQVRGYADVVYPLRRKIFNLGEAGELHVKEQYIDLFEQVRLSMLYHLMGLPLLEYLKLKADMVVYLLNEEKLTDFLWLNYELDNNPFPQLGKFYGPTDFAQLSFEEFSLVDRAFIDCYDYEKHDTIDAELNEFIATLYRAQDDGYDPLSPLTSGDAREPFNQFTVKYRLEEIAPIDRPTKLAVLMWYESSRDLAVANNEIVFKDSGGKGEETTLADTMLAIGGGIQHFDLVRTSSVMLVLADLKRMIIEENKRRKKHEAHTT